MNPFLLIIFYIIVLTITFIAFARDHIKDNWKIYKCQPHIIPFASLFGYDTSENFNKCLYQQSSTNNQVFMSPMYNITDLMSGVMDDLSQSVNSLRESNSQTRDLLGSITGGFIDRISNLTSTLQFLFIKIRTLVERLFGVFTVLIYSSLTTVQLMTSVVNGPIGSMMSVFCFDELTPITMSFRSKKKNIKDIVLDDEINLGGNVISTMVFSALDNLHIYKNNIIVSGGHVVFEDNQWIRVENSKNISSNSNINEKICCITTKNNLIEINGVIFRDYIETSNNFMNSYIKNLIIDYMNHNAQTTDKKPFVFDNKFVSNNSLKIKKSKMDNYYISGFAHDSKIKLLSKYTVNIQDIKLNDVLYDGSRVIGIVKHKQLQSEMYELNGIIVHGETIVNHNKKWMLVKNVPNIKHILSKTENNIIYQLATTNNMIIINNISFRDFTEINDEKINNHIDIIMNNYLNNLK